MEREAKYNPRGGTITVSSKAKTGTSVKGVPVFLFDEHRPRLLLVSGEDQEGSRFWCRYHATGVS